MGQVEEYLRPVVTSRHTRVSTICHERCKPLRIPVRSINPVSRTVYWGFLMQVTLLHEEPVLK